MFPPLALIVITQPADVPPSPVRADERVVLFPGAGSLDADGLWRVNVRGWIYEPERDDLFRASALRSLAKSLGLREDDGENARFRERAAAFLVDNERAKRLALVCDAGAPVLTSESNGGGHFEAALWLDAPNAEHAVVRLDIRVKLPEGDDRQFGAPAYLIPPEGLSVVSDIDDTIKVSNVRDREALLRATFLEEFRAVPGMAAFYQRLHEKGAMFHYVSASPWQLYEPLAAFVQSAGFPVGVWSMREFRLKDGGFLSVHDDPEEYKRSVIEPLLERWPRRKWILIGDSGEKDPEAYLALARKYPERVIRVYIRNVTGEGREAERYRRLTEGIGEETLVVFTEASAIANPKTNKNP